MTEISDEQQQAIAKECLEAARRVFHEIPEDKQDDSQIMLNAVLMAFIASRKAERKAQKRLDCLSDVFHDHVVASAVFSMGADIEDDAHPYCKGGVSILAFGRACVGLELASYLDMWTQDQDIYGSDADLAIRLLKKHQGAE